jgi:hypothetical protein
VLVLDELARFGVTVAFTDSPGLAADDPHATLLTQVQGVIAEYEKAKIADRTGTNLYVSIEYVGVAAALHVVTATCRTWLGGFLAR